MSIIYNSPIELLQAIKENELNYKESRYKMSILNDGFRINLTIIKKREPLRIHKVIQGYNRNIIFLLR